MLVGLLCLHCFKRCSFFENLLNLSLLIQKISFQRKLGFGNVVLFHLPGGRVEEYTLVAWRWPLAWETMRPPLVKRVLSQSLLSCCLYLYANEHFSHPHINRHSH